MSLRQDHPAVGATETGLTPLIVGGVSACLVMPAKAGFWGLLEDPVDGEVKAECGNRSVYLLTVDFNGAGGGGP